MKLREWTKLKHGRMAALAQKLKIAAPVISDWCSQKKEIPVARAAQIEFFTGGEVTRQDMFPDKWQEYWPELAPAPPPPDQPVTELAALPTLHQQPGITALADRRLQIGV